MDAAATLSMQLDDKATDTAQALTVRRKAALANLRMLALVRDEVTTRIAENVGVARSSGSRYYDYDAPTWEDIGKILGISKQAAQQKFKNLTAAS
jgi:predicted DNA binding protein